MTTRTEDESPLLIEVIVMIRCPESGVPEIETTGCPNATGANKKAATRGERVMAVTDVVVNSSVLDG